MRRRTAILAAGILVVIVLLGASKGRTYLSDRPEACSACHEMTPRLAGWKGGPHRRGVTCADCHVPHGGTLEALSAKAGDGLRHGSLHATGNTPRFIHVKRETTRRVLQDNCLRCHGQRVDPAAWRALPPLGTTEARTRPRPDTAFHADASRSCTDCHRATGHGPNGDQAPSSQNR